MSLIAQNTLMGLPDELIVQIVREAVNTGSPIRTYHEYSAKEKELMLAPFSGNEKLETIARAAYYQTNFFSTGIVCIKKSSRVEGKGWTKVAHSHVDRELIRHLEVRLWPLGYGPAQRHPLEDPSEIADDEVRALATLPGLYPNLQTLVVVLEHQPGWIEWDDEVLDRYSSGPRQGELEVLARQLGRALEKLIPAVRALDFPRLRSKTFMFTQDTRAIEEEQPGSVYASRKETNYFAEEGVVLIQEPASRQPLRRAVTLEAQNESVNIWEIMDLPRAMIRLQGRRPTDSVLASVPRVDPIPLLE